MSSAPEFTSPIVMHYYVIKFKRKRISLVAPPYQETCEGQKVTISGPDTGSEMNVSFVKLKSRPVETFHGFHRTLRGITRWPFDDPCDRQAVNNLLSLNENSSSDCEEQEEKMLQSLRPSHLCERSHAHRCLAISTFVISKQ